MSLPINLCHAELRCTAVGDSGSGKIELLSAYEKYDSHNEREVFLEYSTCKVIDNYLYRFSFTEIPTIERTTNLRRLSYKSPACVYIVCFSVLSRPQFIRAFEYWIPEIRRHAVDVPIVVVGTDSQLRRTIHTNTRQTEKLAVTRNEAERKARLGNYDYYEISNDNETSVMDFMNGVLEKAVGAPAADVIRKMYGGSCQIM